MLLSLHIYTFRPIKHFSFSDNEDVYCICKFNSLFMNSAHVFQKIFFFLSLDLLSFISYRADILVHSGSVCILSYRPQ